jgi:excisionase family DNA binding protein
MKTTQSGNSEVPIDWVLAVSVDEAAMILGVSRSTVYALMGDGLLPYFKIGRRRLIYRKDLEEFIRRQRISVKADDISKTSSETSLMDRGMTHSGPRQDEQASPESQSRKIPATMHLTPPPSHSSGQIRVRKRPSRPEGAGIAGAIRAGGPANRVSMESAGMDGMENAEKRLPKGG